MGINRVSLGVQSLNDDCLTFLGRNHTSDVSRRTLARLGDAGFDNVSVDVMFALPEFPDVTLHDTVNELLDFRPQHVSAYSLSITEPGTPFKRRRVAKASVAQDAGQFEWLRDRLGMAGFGHYEVSNYAQSGRESRHNTAYWMGWPFIGLGPGAHSFFNGGRYHHARNLAAYIANPVPRVFRQKRFPTSSPQALWEDYVMMRLRLLEGVSFQEVALRFGADQASVFRESAVCT